MISYGTEWAENIKARVLAGEKLLPIQLTLAAGALGEDWRNWKAEIIEVEIDDDPPPF